MEEREMCRRVGVFSCLPHRTNVRLASWLAGGLKVGGRERRCGQRCLVIEEISKGRSLPSRVELKRAQTEPHTLTEPPKALESSVRNLYNITGPCDALEGWKDIATLSPSPLKQERARSKNSCTQRNQESKALTEASRASPPDHARRSLKGLDQEPLHSNQAFWRFRRLRQSLTPHPSLLKP